MGNAFRSYGKSEYGVREFSEKACEFRNIGKGLNRRAHGVHTKHKYGKSEHYASDVFLLVLLGKHNKYYTYDGKNR